MPNHLLTTRAGCAALGTPPGVRTIGLARCVAIILSTWAVLVGAGPSHALIGVWGFWESSSTIREASASHIELHGGHAYVSSQRINSPYFDPVSFRILDVSDASLPVSRGALSLPDGARGSQVEGSLAYVAGADSGLFVIDVSNPDAPAVLGSVDTPGSAVAVAVSSGVAFVADEGGGLRVVDVSTPATPVEIASLTTVGTVYDLAAITSDMLVLIGGTTLWTVDVSDPTMPGVAGSEGLVGLPRMIELVGSFAYVGAGYVSSNQGLQVVDLTDPSMPAHQGAISPTRSGDYFGVNGIDVHDGRAYVAVSDSDLEGALWVLDLAAPATPDEVGFFALSRPKAGCARIVDGIAYVCSSSYDRYAVHLVDLSSTRLPNEIDALPLADGAWDVVLSGDRAYVAAGTEGLKVMTGVIGGGPLAVAGNVDTPGVASALAVSGELALIADGPGGLRVVDVSSATAPTEVGHFDTMGNATYVQVVGSIAYVTSEADGGGGGPGWQVVDVSNPSLPAELMTIALSEPTRHVLVAGDRAYVSHGYVTIYDLGDPTAPSEIDQILGGAYIDAKKVVLRDGLMYVLGEAYDPITMQVLEELSPDSWWGYEWGYLGSADESDVEVEGDVTYVAVPGGVRALRGPAGPGTAALSLGGDFRSIGQSQLAVQSPLVAVADRAYGLRLIDLGPDHGTIAVPIPILSPKVQMLLLAMLLVAASSVLWIGPRAAAARGLGGR